MEKYFNCPYCHHVKDASKPPLLDTSKISKKHDGYCGMMVSVDQEDNCLATWVSSDTYEPWCENYDIPINFCPMCGRALSGGDENE